MSETVIKVENLSKLYRLGVVGTGTLTHDINRWWHKVRGKEDPYSKIGETNVRETGGESEYVWALKDINFEVKQGEVLGIIGKNGAGKSTLLKLLSKVTGPTDGRILAKGRIASLLEVGTGFHPELTGRENIYLNGTILGMTRREVDRKLEEIVEFAGVARYVDTPVKRYSSGMKVRLGFAVAAHLEPEILIVDEVLAVGDAEFQKKAIGKMQEVSHQGGRTVLFVSHNMASVKSLCTRAMLLTDGNISINAETDLVISKYLSHGLAHDTATQKVWKASESPGTEGVYIRSARVHAVGKSFDDPVLMGDSISIEVGIENRDKSLQHIGLTLQFQDDMGNYLFVSGSGSENRIEEYNNQIGEFIFQCVVPGHLLNEGNFVVNALIVENNKSILYRHEYLLGFTVVSGASELGQWMGKTKGPLKPRLNWEVRRLVQDTSNK